jgi:FkbM family methyltransferase
MALDLPHKHFKKLFNKIGFDIRRYNYLSSPKLRRLKLLRQYDIDLIFDVGANIGQYGRELRESGYKGRLISFEPLSEAYNKLNKATIGDTLWEAVNIALGNFDGNSLINISCNSYSSSLLDILPSVVKNCPEAAYIDKQEVVVRKIDSIINNYWNQPARLYVKIDTQGYERNVIEGALSSLSKIIGFEMELSLITLYEGETLYIEMINYLFSKGYDIMSLDPGFSDNDTGRLLQVDCIFFRSHEMRET